MNSSAKKKARRRAARAKTSIESSLVSVNHMDRLMRGDVPDELKEKLGVTDELKEKLECSVIQEEELADVLRAGPAKKTSRRKLKEAKQWTAKKRQCEKLDAACLVLDKALRDKTGGNFDLDVCADTVRICTPLAEKVRDFLGRDQDEDKDSYVTSFVNQKFAVPFIWMSRAFHGYTVIHKQGHEAPPPDTLPNAIAAATEVIQIFNQVEQMTEKMGLVADNEAGLKAMFYERTGEVRISRSEPCAAEPI